MMGVGEFAQATGLTVKALHLYDERGILTPAEVDPQSGYRRYAAAQLREGLLLKALRDVGVPLGELAGNDVREAFTGLLARRLADIQAERRSQDAAAAAARTLYERLTTPLPVEQRRAAAQPYAAAVLRVPESDEDPDILDEAVGGVLTELWERLDAEDNPPTGPFWLSFGGPGRAGRPGADRFLPCCWPVAREPEGSNWAGGSELAGTGALLAPGTLPDRDELFLRWPPAGMDAAADGAEDPAGPHPALAALLEAVEAREDIDPGRLRQVTFMGADGGPGGVELSYSLAG